MTVEQSLRTKLEQSYSPTHYELVNESHQHTRGANPETHFRLVLVSPAFEGLPRLERQRRVMELFKDERARGLHALTLRVMTPSEWDKVKHEFEMESPACAGGSKRELK